jgi:uncharacterized surface protein with fasciclin (FAS1) repeats
MRIRHTLHAACGLLFAGVLGVTSCQDIADDEHYKAPSWLKGNAWQVMEEDGGYTQFLKAIELTGYRPIVDGQSILTVMAPNDQAWTSYLQQMGYASVEDMNAQAPTELKKAVGFHLMYYAYDWDKLVNFRPNEGDGASEDALSQNAGMWYKHRTRSQDAMEDMRGKLNGVDTLVTVYHYERFLPVFSNKFFETKSINAKTNYEYFYPQSQWSVTGNGFQVSNASVTDQTATVTDNGYLYRINQVIRPLETIYQTLKKNPNYSDFISLYDQYAEFSPAATETSDNVGKPVYQLTHGSLPDIACEWPVSNFRQMSQLSSVCYNIFAPSNQAISRFFQNYWTAQGGYGSLTDLDPLILQYFIFQSFASDTEPIFPEEINNGQVETSYGTPININTNDVDDRLMCENGVVYGMNDMKAPAIFSSVVGPAFKDTTYQCFLYTLDKSDLVLSLASDKSEFVTLIPSNQQYKNNEPTMRLNVTTQGKNLEVYSDVDGNYANVGQGLAQDIVNMHYATGISQLQTSGIQVVQLGVPFNYWFVHNGKITTNARFNEQLNPAYTGTPFVDFHEIQNAGQSWANGRSYSYDAQDLFTAQSGDGLEHLLAVGNDKNYEYYLFAQLLQKAGLVSNGLLPSLAGEGMRLVVFVPTNEAIRQNIANIPGCSGLTVAADYTLTGNVAGNNKSALANYLRRYFVSSLMNTITAYPYPGSPMKGRYLAMSGESVCIEEANGQLKIWLANNSEEVNITAPTIHLVDVSQKYFQLPFAFSDGCMQLIDGILTDSDQNNN